MATVIALLLMILACIQVSRCDYPAENVTIEGYPRPKNFPDAPTVAYGKFPATRNSSGAFGTCDWYGWANKNSPAALGAPCLPYVWETYIIKFLILFPDYLPNSYDYYYCRVTNVSSPPDPVCYDNAAQDIICAVGCFDLSKTSLGLPPITKPGESTGTNVASDGAAARVQPFPLVLSMLAGADFKLLARAG